MDEETTAPPPEVKEGTWILVDRTIDAVAFLLGHNHCAAAKTAPGS